jgi:hypothetical protein
LAISASFRVKRKLQSARRDNAQNAPEADLQKPYFVFVIFVSLVVSTSRKSTRRDDARERT